MNTRLLILIFLLLVFKSIKAQDLPEIVYPSPTASALGEYGNTPISLSTGTPNINIPIWEVKGKKLSVPISLSYRASGIKVEEHGSQVGLGWTLNAGGMITRILKDKDDLMYLNTFRAPIIDKNFFSINQYRNGFDFSFDGQTDLVKTLNNTLIHKDKIPDMFYYNFLNYSGKFIFDDADNPMIAPDISFKINKGNITKITDTNGDIYTFDLNESDQGSSAITGWYLTKIESADLSEWIDFEYVSEISQTLVNKKDALFINYNSQWSANSIPWYKSSVNIGYRLNKIITSFGETITFNPGEAREDLHNISSIQESKKPKTIGDIEISYSGTCIKKIDFEYEFIESETPGYLDVWWAGTNFDLTWANKRLYLKSLKEKNCNNDDVKTYAFKYYGRNSVNKDLLPSKLSYAQDHWGYFNGKILNTTLRPSFSGNIPDFNGISHYRVVSGADRTPSYPHMEFGTLKSITYPTGGETEFVFEQHQNIGAGILPEATTNTSPYAGGLRIKEVNEKIEDATVKSKNYTYYSGYYADYPRYGNTDLVYVTESYNGESEQLHHFIHPGVIAPHVNEGDDKPYYKIGSGHPINLGTTNGYHLNYQLVKEAEVGSGYVNHQFSTSNWSGLGVTAYDDIDVLVDWVQKPIGYSTWHKIGLWNTYSFKWPFVGHTDFSWKRGLPISKSYFSEDGNSIKSISYNYDFIELKGIRRNIRYTASDELEEFLDYNNPSSMYETTIARTTFRGLCATGNFCHDIESTIYYQQSKIGLGIALKTSETIIENNITTVKNYTYNNQNQLASTTFTNSKGETIVSESKYPQDFAASNNVYEKMVDANVLNPVIEQKTKNEGVTLSTLKNNFHEWETNSFAPKIIESSKGTNALEDRVEFLDYYDNGNVQEVKKSDGIHIVYIWGYNEQYPIAKIENATYSDISSQVANLHTKSNDDDDITVDVIDNSGAVTNYIGNEGALRSALATLRNLTALSDALVTTYTYNPLIGVTSMTDPKGYTMYYEYDDFNRLKQVKDASGKILSQNEYHYKGQQ